MTIGVALRSLTWRSIVAAAAVMIGCLLPMAAWYLTHPERNSQIVSAYQLSSTADRIVQYVHLYWSFFDPSYQLISGDASLINTTRQSGLFPLAFALLVPMGVIVLWRSGQPVRRTIVGGFFAAPVVSVISGAIEMNRVMFAIPFTVLVAT